MKLTLSKIKQRQEILYNHPLLNGNYINDFDSLHIFMEHHVYAVWDFMCLLKSLQHHICPSGNIWLPNKWIRSGLARLINDIVISEESDLDLDGNGVICHHDMYCQAMLEVGADGKDFEDFIESVTYEGFRNSVQEMPIPAASKRFMEETFSFIETGEPHIVAAAFCFGRETMIPEMFSRITSQLNITKEDAPKFHYYLERHIHLDGEEHGPASVRMIETLCENDPVHIHEAEQAALNAIDARIRLWDGVLDIIQNHKSDWRHG